MRVEEEEKSLIFDDIDDRSRFSSSFRVRVTDASSGGWSGTFVLRVYVRAQGHRFGDTQLCLGVVAVVVSLNLRVGSSGLLIFWEAVCERWSTLAWSAIGM